MNRQPLPGVAFLVAMTIACVAAAQTRPGARPAAEAAAPALPSIRAVADVRGAEAPGVTEAQRVRLDRKLALVDAIARSLEPEIRTRELAAATRTWLLESLLPLSVEQLEALGTPRSLAAVGDAIAQAAAQTPKAIGSVSSDLTYTPFVPCRYIDTRVVGGKISGARTFNLANAGSTYGGNAACTPVTLSGASAAGDIAALALNITIVDTSTATVPGFATVRPTGSTAATALVNWTQASAGFQLGNAAVVTTSQGSPNQFDIFTSGSVQAIVDAFGAFLRPGATPLDCSDAGTSASTGIDVDLDASISSLACPAGRFPVSGECLSDNGYVNLVRSQSTTVLSATSVWTCTFHNFDTAAHTITVRQVCCSVPGR